MDIIVKLKNILRISLFGCRFSGKARFWSVCLLAAITLLVSGSIYRVTSLRLQTISEIPITLPVPLSEFPIRVDDWVGKDVPISASVQRVAGNDDFLNRMYVDESRNQWVNVYIAYSARPRTMIGHRPQACYRGGGWLHDGTEKAELSLFSGKKLPCLVHRFHKPDANRTETVVLNFYIVNGQLTDDESVFSGLGWRTPNIAGNAARYVAQIQISSTLENSVRRAAIAFTESIQKFFPDGSWQQSTIEN